MDRRVYAEILFRWGEFIRASEVLKYCPEIKSPDHSGLGIVLTRKASLILLEPVCFCEHCRRESKCSVCLICNRCTSVCAVCRGAVRGPCTYCMICGHGGHATHIKAWFNEEDTCPTGCGCVCPQ